MYKSYFTIAWRNLFRNQGYSFINIGGLAIGMAVALLIGLWVYDELTFNRYHKNYRRIAQVLRSGSLNGETLTTPYLPYALGDELATRYGNTFKQVIVVWPAGDHILSAGKDKSSFNGIFIQPGGPEMFTLNMLAGSSDALNDPHAILLSRSAATALFGHDDPLDKLLKIDNAMDAKVAGVYEDLPYHSHFHGVQFFAPWDLLVSVSTWIKFQGFTNNFLEIYVQLEDHATFETASAQIKDAILNNVREDKLYVTINPQIFLHPMEKWHLWSDWENGVNTGLIQTVWLFAIAGGFVLLLACINFMNLSTARSERRSKEVGIRKAIGSVRLQLVSQFFSESVLVTAVAFAFAIILVSVSLEWFNTLAGKQMEMPWYNLYFWLTGLVFILFTGLLAGSYPAFFLSSFNSVRALKGAVRPGRFASLPRKILVVGQFTVSVVLIIGTIIVYKQVLFAKDRPVGYDRNGLLMVRMASSDFNGRYDVLRHELKNTGVVSEMAQSSSPPTDIWNSNGGFDWKGKDPAFIPEFSTFTVTPEYGKTMGWQFVAGRDFLKGSASDSLAFIINESAAKILGFSEPVGETVQWQSWWTNGPRQFTIIGVVKDMVMKSPYAPAAPAVFFLGGSVNWMAIRIDPKASPAKALPSIESVFKKVIPAVPFTYKFADQEYALKFAREERIGKLASVFAVLAILISCLGLFGLAAFVAEQRTKEIGIRKVVGASVFNLWKMLSRDFVVLVLIACLIAVPLAYYGLAAWLKKYDYRTEISWWIFFITCTAAIAITLLTVSYQSIKAATMNPVKSLRSE